MSTRGYGLLLIALFFLGGWWLWSGWQSNSEELITGSVDKGVVRSVVTVSGYVEADNTAALAFPTTGRVSGVYVEEGNTVEPGTLLATIGQATLAAEREVALANLEKVEAARLEVINGQTIEEREVTDATVAQAQAAWEQTVATELEKVRNAETALYSSDLQAYSTDPDELATAPTVTGSFVCAGENNYHLTVYRSGTNSGYSFTYEGIEEGKAAASVDQPVALGECGLSLQFTADDRYSKSEWSIPIPNTRSSSYLSKLNALNLARQQAKENIQAAKDALTLAQNVATRDTAAPRVEALIIENANVRAAQAELARIDARLFDQAIYAPFAGVITEIKKLTGEVATTEPMITLLAEDAFTLIARIPEIDITKINRGQVAEAIFDAKPDDQQIGKIAFINPIATEIDGVAYFETKISFISPPDWLRSGLNADINIIIDEVNDINRLPRRFIEQTADGVFVTILYPNQETQHVPVEVGIYGTDGMVEIKNLDAGTVVIAP